jgi:hypothetical protein
MLNTDMQSIIMNIRKKDSLVYSIRSMVIHVYKHQMIYQKPAWHVFEAFFTLLHDANWCKRQIHCRHHTLDNNIVWPPLSKRPITLPRDTLIQIMVINKTIFVPLIPVFMDQKTLQECFSMYSTYL